MYSNHPQMTRDDLIWSRLKHTSTATHQLEASQIGLTKSIQIVPWNCMHWINAGGNKNDFLVLLKYYLQSHACVIVTNCMERSNADNYLIVPVDDFRSIAWRLTSEREGNFIDQFIILCQLSRTNAQSKMLNKNYWLKFDCLIFIYFIENVSKFQNYIFFYCARCIVVIIVWSVEGIWSPQWHRAFKLTPSIILARALMALGINLVTPFYIPLVNMQTNL